MPSSLDPIRELDEILRRQGLSRRPHAAPSGHETVTNADWIPAIDIVETADEYVVKAELTEIAKDAIRISVNAGVLTLQGERQREEDSSGFRYHRVERPYGTFQRSFSLPEDVEEQNIRAEHREGMLYLHLPKHKEQPPRAIQIKVE